MDSLKYLGKPAPLSGQIETRANGHVIRYLREEHLEGAIKEAAEIFEDLANSEKRVSEKQRYLSWGNLLRRTLNEGD